MKTRDELINKYAMKNVKVNIKMSKKLKIKM